MALAMNPTEDDSIALSPAPMFEWLTTMPFTKNASALVDLDLHIQELIADALERQERERS